MILSLETQRDIRNAALSALHYIAFEMHCDVPDIIAIITTPSQPDPKQAAPSAATAPGGVTGGEEPSILPATPIPEAPKPLPDDEIMRRPAEAKTSDQGALSSEPGEMQDESTIHLATPSPEPQPTSTPAVQAQAVEPSSKVLDGPSHLDTGSESAADPAPTPKKRVAGRQNEVARLHAEHPDWTGKQIAAEMGVIVQYVTKAASRLGLTLPLKTVAAEGKRASAEGTLIKDKIKALHAEHPEFHAEQAAQHLSVVKGTLDSASFKMGIKWAKKPKPAPEPARSDIDPRKQASEAFDARLTALHQAEPHLIRPRLAERLGVTRSQVNAAVARLGLHVPHARSSDDQPYEPEIIPPATPQTPVAPPPLGEMKTMSDRVAALHHQHPTWTGRMIANELGANPGSVSVALARIRNPKAAPVEEAKPEFTGRRQMVEHYGEIAKRLGKPS